MPSFGNIHNFGFIRKLMRLQFLIHFPIQNIALIIVSHQGNGTILWGMYDVFVNSTFQHFQAVLCYFANTDFV